MNGAYFPDSTELHHSSKTDNRNWCGFLSWWIAIFQLCHGYGQLTHHLAPGELSARTQLKNWIHRDVIHSLTTQRLTAKKTPKCTERGCFMFSWNSPWGPPDGGGHLRTLHRHVLCCVFLQFIHWTFMLMITPGTLRGFSDFKLLKGHVWV